jgi:hypothetical protein
VTPIERFNLTHSLQLETGSLAPGATPLLAIGTILPGVVLGTAVGAIAKGAKGAAVGAVVGGLVGGAMLLGSLWFLNQVPVAPTS